MNAKSIQQHTTVTQWRYQADLFDAYHLASEATEWLGVLITEAKRNIDHPYRAKKLLEIAEYLAMDRMSDFDNFATHHDPEKLEQN